jgi:hypothetical protein
LNYMMTSRLRRFISRAGALPIRQISSRRTGRSNIRTVETDMSFDPIEGYTKVLADLGQTLTADLGIPEHAIVDAECRLGIDVPEVLTSMILVASRAQVFSSTDNRLFAPEEWTVDNGRLIIFESNEGQYLWAIDAEAGRADDPIIFRAATEGGIPCKWKNTETTCSDFLRVMLYWDAAFGGGMPFCETASVAFELVEKLDRDWNYIGRLDGMRAYGKHGRALCFVEWGKDNWTVFAGATDASALASIANEIGLTWE